VQPRRPRGAPGLRARFQERRPSAFAGLQVINLIKRGSRDFYRGTAEIVIIEFLGSWATDGERDARNAGARHGADRRGAGAAPGFSAVILFRAKAREKRARSFGARKIRHQQGLAAFS